MKKIVLFSLFTFFVLLFGCIDLFGPPQPTVNNSSVDNATKNTTFTITGQKNYTVADNTTIPIDIKNLTGLEVQQAANYTYAPDEQVYVFFIYVGGDGTQADSILIKKGDADILVDTGPASATTELVEFLKARGVDDLELLVLTHADPDHYGGTPVIMGNFTIGKVLWSGRNYNDGEFQQILDKLSERNIPLKSAVRGDAESINGINLTLLHPIEKSFASVDEDAIVLKLTDREFCVLLTSDIFGGGFDDVMKKTNITCDIIQIPRHGADNIGVWITNFLTDSSADAAIISGAYKKDQSNLDFRKPLLELLEQRDIVHYENYYVNGSIRIVSDGAEYDIDYAK